MVPEDEEIPCFLVKFSFLLILRIIKWPVPSNMVIKGNFAHVRCRTGSPVLLRTPYLLLIHPAALTCECRICTGVQSSLQGLLLLALNDSAETDPLRSLTQGMVQANETLALLLTVGWSFSVCHLLPVLASTTVMCYLKGGSALSITK